jgi:hypothetical protein
MPPAEPAVLLQGKAVSSVAAGAEHSVVATTDGQVSQPRVSQ